VPSCRDVSELATDYMEGALNWRGRIAVRWHLGVCSMCRAHLDRLGKTQHLLGRSVLAAPAVEIEDRLVAAREDGSG
jgi:predicted anti-sigma-YlaC factor YlaD